MTDKILKLDYSKIVESYWNDLTEVLRGFNSEDVFLEMWVPDEDHAKSIANLIEAVQLGECDAFDLILSKETAEELEMDALNTMTSGLGDVTLETVGDHNVLKVRNLQEGSLFQAVHPCYREKIRDAYKSIEHEGPLGSQTDQILIQVIREGITLSVLVHPKNHKILDASHEGIQDPIQKGVFEALCETLIGLPVQESSEHALIALEFKLRDQNEKHHVSGIITPKNADPVFHLPLAMTRELLEHYQEKTGYKLIQNFFTKMPQPEWRKLPIEGKKQRLYEVLNNLSDTLSIPKNSIEITEVRDAKVTIQFLKDLGTSLEKAILLGKLEDSIKQEIDEQLQLYLGELKDMNVIRREV